ncbi:MAG: argininosuccinate lyase [Calditrichaeota bacterium]|nr:MAG: argininosuccinate lyase [Calditrichota bacterium]
MGKTRKVWSGRIEGAVSPLMERFSRSVETDFLMWREDISVNRVWAAELAEIGIYSADELKSVLAGIDKIAGELETGNFEFEPVDEDIHVAIERRLTEIVGDAGARIHTGRSRNDQVVTDSRLYLKGRAKDWQIELVRLQDNLLTMAKDQLGVILPGYTHWQQAQPILLSHYILAIFWGVDRTISRLKDYLHRIDVCPLGSGALAGSAFSVDRERIALKLGFREASQNSIDATGERDFCSELLFAIAAYFTHLSRIAAELQMWNSLEFSFIEFSDAYATGSSMMPQKKNPDAMELIRGKSAAAIAGVNQLLVLQKGLPLTYNRDLQEDKKVTFAQLEEAILATDVFREALSGATFRVDKMQQALEPGLLATDLADYLVQKGVPFRQAHEIIGQIVQRSLQEKCQLTAFTLEKFNEFSEFFEDDVFKKLQFPVSVAQRIVIGGTAEKAVQLQIAQAEDRLKAYQ